MSKVVKGIGKVFKAIGHAIKSIVKSPIFKVIVAAVAIYFTAGAAAGYFAGAEAAAGAAVGTVGEATAGELAVTAVADESAGLAMGAATEAGATGAAEAAGAAAVDESAGLAMDAAAGSSAGDAAGAATLAGDESAGLAMSEGSASSNLLAPAAEAGPTELGAASTGVEDGVAANTGLAEPTAADAATSGVSPAQSTLANTGSGPGNPFGPGAMDQGVGLNQVATQMGGQPAGFLQNLWSEFKALSPAAQTLLGQGVAGVGKGVAGAIDARNKQAMQDQMLAEHARMRAVPDVRYMFNSSPASKGFIARATLPQGGS